MTTKWATDQSAIRRIFTHNLGNSPLIYYILIWLCQNVSSRALNVSVVLAETTQLGDARFHALWSVCLVFFCCKKWCQVTDRKNIYTHLAIPSSVVKVSVPVVADHTCRGEGAATDRAGPLPPYSKILDPSVANVMHSSSHLLPVLHLDILQLM